MGSPRVITDQYGQVKSRRDFMPFGEDLAPDTNNRTASLKYNADEVRQKFTGYQKDNETGLDFAEARMYNNAHGRFTAVDPLMASGKSANPQTFNRYVYTSNNPVIRIDINGLEWYVAHKKGKDGRTYRIPEWVAGDKAKFSGRNRWKDKDPYIYATNEGGSTRYAVINPYEDQGEDFGSLEEAQTRYKDYQKQAVVDFIGGALSAYSIILDYTGAAEGMSANRNSEVFQVGQNAGTGASIASIFLGGGIANAVVNRFGRTGLSILKGLKVGCYFTARTPIRTDKGLIPIEQIKIGDRVLSYDEKTKTHEYKFVAQTFTAVKENIVKIKIRGEKLLTTTTEHPFYVKKTYKARDSLPNGDDKDGEWLTAAELRVGQKVLRPDGKWTRITAIEHSNEPTLVYNLEVEGNHNYFVGEIGVLSHNCNAIFKEALGGGKHAGFLKNYLGRGADELNKSINTLQSGKRGIDVHMDKIANPSKYVSDWDTLRLSHQQSLINGWQKEITNATEQIQILRGILGR